MIYINEWLPNPVGRDDSVTGGEFVELYNSGPASMRLDGYALGTGAKKKFSLTGYSIASGGYLVLKKTQTKLSLKNTGGELLLYGPGGSVVDEASFSGAAPEGKSFARVNYSAAPVGHFVFEYPTPGAPNKAVDTTVEERDYLPGVSLVRQLGTGAFLILMLATASFFLVFLMYVTRNNRNVSHFLFGGDEETGL